ncbi:Hypothetical predicted protein [Olea europaea subsp. europaea]|uniref:Uncharacterized protein n=1 Tax=Olea europaea subsp. europaea TaxID=158383 RepID=A0A8S0V246_OLEEU|nr:Hypothetical predicted protein [Olea europaea subsp. europaea]
MAIIVIGCDDDSFGGRSDDGYSDGRLGDVEITVFDRGGGYCGVTSNVGTGSGGHNLGGAGSDG